MSEESVRKLTGRLEEDRPRLERLDRYYTGSQPLAFLAPEVRETVGKRLQNLVVNWPRLVVQAIEERLDIEGFRLEEDAPPDSTLWDIWQANGLDEMSQQGHTEALVHGRAFVIVWADENGEPRITVESAKQVTVEHSPGSRQRRRALKKWTEDGHALAVLYEPTQITRWRNEGKVPDAGDSSYVPAGAWNLVETIENPLGVVPVVPLVNRPRLLLPGGESELVDVLPICDAVNKLATDMMVSAEFHAGPRRWASGIEIAEIPELDEEGNETGEMVPDPKQFSQVAGRTWIAEAAESKFGQFPEASLEGFIHAIEMLTQQLSSITSIPPHYLNILKGQLSSAESIRSAEASLVSKARRKMRSFGGTWEEVMRIALAARNGSAARGMESCETVWRDPETRTVAQAADAAAKLVGAGIIPAQQAQEDIGYSPVQRDRMRKMARQSALDVLASDPARLLP